MNKHIELVKKWLADPESVSQQELKDNVADACTYAANYPSAVTYAALGAAAYVAAATYADQYAACICLIEINEGKL